MNTVQVSGRFRHENGNLAEGEIEFIPQRMWVEGPDGLTYPTMAPKHTLVNGAFLVYLTRTDTEELPWMYQVKVPGLSFHVEITEDGPLYLSHLMRL